MSKKLELVWEGKETPLRPEPRILIEKPELSYSVDGENVSKDNILIHGDNLLALKALEKDYSGKVKCIYIDPPYNTGSAFEHYNDNFEHSIWLNLMKNRIELLYNLLAENGIFCVQIDDSEGAYLKVMLDEIFGRNNYLTTFYIRVRYPDKTLKEAMDFQKEIEQIHIYRKQYGAEPNFKYQNVGFDKFNFFVKEKGSSVKTITLGGKKVEIFDKGTFEIVQKEEGSEFGLKEIWASGTILDGNSSGRFFRDYLTGRYKEDGYGVLYKVYGIGDDRFDYRYFTGPQREGATKGKYFQGVPIDKLNANENLRKLPINGFYDFASNFGNCRQEGGVGFRGGKKPEALLKMLIEMFTKEGDLVLDSFAGSGSTAATAQKLNRQWITIEMGEHAYSLCKIRLDSVISGKDKSGITKDVNYQGGGSYKFYELAPTLIVKNALGIEVINKEYNAEQLAAAVALHEGYDYQPDENIFWKQSKASENSYLFVTTSYITPATISQIEQMMGKDEYLLIACKAFDAACEETSKKITIKKIPQMLLKLCEFGKDDYSLNIVNPPFYEDDDEE